MKELKPCPFCGSHDVELMLGSERFVRYQENSHHDSVFVGCDFCGATSSHFEFNVFPEKGTSTKEEAARRAMIHWNTCSTNVDLAFQLRDVIDGGGQIDRETMHLLVKKYLESQTKK